METEVSRVVAASAREVWGVVTDIEGSPAVLTAVERVERLDDHPGFGVGTRWQETRTMYGRQATEEMEVTAVEAPSTYTVVAVNGATTYTSTIAVRSLATDRCELRMTFSGRSTGLVGRLLAATVGRLFAGATRRSLQRDLDDIAGHVEGDRRD
jgi:uncharacterized membrane protein